MTDNTFQFQGKTWRVVQQRGDIMSAEIVPPAKPDVLEELDAEIASSNYWDVSRCGLPQFQAMHRATVNAALKLMREEMQSRIENCADAQEKLDAVIMKRLEKAEARIAELEAAKIWPATYPGVGWPVAPGPYSFAGNCPRCHQPPGVCQCPSVTVTGAIAGLTVGENVVPLTVGEKK